MAIETLTTPDTSEPKDDDRRNPLWPEDIKALDELGAEDPVAAREYALELAEGAKSGKGRTIEVTDPDSGEVTHLPVVHIGHAAVRPPVAIEDPGYAQARADNWHSTNK